jgi:hypothetical protein
MDIYQDKLDKALAYLYKKKKVGNVLIDLELISPKDLRLALKQQKLIQSQMGVRKSLGILLFQMRIGRL